MMKSKRQKPRRSLSKAKLDEMIAEATVDAYGDSEQIMGFFCLLEERLQLPFNTEVLGIEVTVESLDVTDEEEIVVICSRGKSRQRISILDLPLPSPPPQGAEWIDALRRWARGK
jgi:c-di-GMP-related signal transduction protein